MAGTEEAAGPWPPALRRHWARSLPLRAPSADTILPRVWRQTRITPPPPRRRHDPAACVAADSYHPPPRGPYSYDRYRVTTWKMPKPAPPISASQSRMAMPPASHMRWVATIANTAAAIER
jgi:hypothetical protein